MVSKSWVRRRRWKVSSAPMQSPATNRNAPIGESSPLPDRKSSDVHACALVVEIWEARNLSADAHGVAPDVAARVTVGERSQTSALRPHTCNPVWGDPQVCT